ncbi:MAG: hypothetical protein JXA20_00225 [Spirochaetes bacterium]|nr:hypothetical protein [Spirochaetota bacterium]
MVRRLCFVLMVALLPTGAAGYITPVQISLLNPLQVFPDTWGVLLLRVNLLYGYNTVVIGADVGAVNRSTQLYGIQGGILNIVQGFDGGIAGKSSGGLQAGLVNVDLVDFYGIQLGGLANGSLSLTGFQAAVINGAIDMEGFQAGGMNFAASGGGVQVALVNMVLNSAGSWEARGGGEYRGLQVGALYNYADNLAGMQLCAFINSMGGETAGVQIGIINTADRVRGLQIGLINYAVRMSGVQIGLINIIREGALPFFPIFNASFRY